MKIAGIVAEYNPFHNGHKYHIQKTREKTNAEVVIAIMSGNFVQRGDCAIYDKWSRAYAAVLGGVDIVIELPTYYSLGVASLFAFGAVSTLNALGCIDFISFGTETEDINTLYFLAKALVYENDKIEDETKKLLNNQIGYPQAREQAICKMFDIDADLLKTPNNMLAIEYMKSLFLIKSNITPIGIKRIGSNYHDTCINSDFSSATAIRKTLFEGKSIVDNIPDDVCDVFKEKVPMFTQNFDKAVISFLRRATPESLKNIIDMPYGFENRIVSMAKKASTIDELVDLCCVRQYTRARIRRLIFASFIGMQNFGYDKMPSYVRILAANKKGRSVLAKINDTSSLPIITKTADFTNKDSDELFLLDVMATNLFYSSYDDEKLRIGNKDFTTSPIML